jgi:multisubunit Na+/H+ antiporter MnhC subunit
LSLLSHAGNLFIFTMGGLAVDAPPILSVAASHRTDPLPQALALTAIVISFGTTALAAVIALRSNQQLGTDRVDEGDAGNDWPPRGGP